MRDLTSPEERILDKALYLIGKNGSFHVPIRAIAKEANVNVSAINYYFRTKDEMLKHVKEFYIENTIAAYSTLDNDEYDDEEKIMLCANEIMEYTLKYPGILTILREARKEKDIDEISAKIVKVTDTMNVKMDVALSKVFDQHDVSFQYNRTMFLSSILYPIINIEFLNFGENFVNNKDQRLKYIAYIIKILKANSKV